MRVVGGLVLGEDAAPVRRDDRVRIRSLVRPGVLRDQGGASASAEHRYRPRFRVLPDREALRGRGRRLRLRSSALNRARREGNPHEHDRCEVTSGDDLFHGWLTSRDGSGKVGRI